MIDQQRVTLTRADARVLIDYLQEAPINRDLDQIIPNLIQALDNAQLSASDDVAQLIITIAQGD